MKGGLAARHQHLDALAGRLDPAGTVAPAGPCRRNSRNCVFGWCRRPEGLRDRRAGPAGRLVLQAASPLATLARAMRWSAGARAGTRGGERCGAGAAGAEAVEVLLHRGVVLVGSRGNRERRATPPDQVERGLDLLIDGSDHPGQLLRVLLGGFLEHPAPVAGMSVSTRAHRWAGPTRGRFSGPGCPAPRAGPPAPPPVSRTAGGDLVPAVGEQVAFVEGLEPAFFLGAQVPTYLVAARAVGERGLGIAGPADGARPRNVTEGEKQIAHSRSPCQDRILHLRAVLWYCDTTV